MLRYQFLERVKCVLWISGLYTSRLLDAASKKVLNLLKKGLMVLGEAKTTSTQTSPTTQAQVTYVSESISYLKFEAKTLNIRVILFTVKMEILLEPTSNKLMVEHVEFDESNAYVLERFYTLARNPVKEILLKLNLPDHSIKVKEIQRSFHHSDTERLSLSDEVLKLKNFKKDAAIKLFKSTNQERYEHVGPEVISSQDGKVYKMKKRDYAWLMISSGAGGPGVASQGSSHSRWTKRRVQIERISPQKRTLTQPASQPSTSSQVPVSETRNVDGREMGDGVPTQSSVAGGASEWSFL
ncbi:hypothetical protein Tco_1337286 [Tanacetum coccineum]